MIEEAIVAFEDGVQRSFWYRPGTSDHHMLDQAFRDQAFRLNHLKRWPDIEKWLSEHPKPLIIDAGANIGTSAVYLAHAFPTAKIVAIEPERANFDLLNRNTTGLNVECLHAALTGEGNGMVDLFRRESNAGFTLLPGDEDVAEVVKATSINHLTVNHEETPFLAKIDIEGGEIFVFDTDIDWIDRFPVIMVELHDWLYPKHRLAHTFLTAIADKDRDFILSGEHVISIRNDL